MLESRQLLTTLGGLSIGDAETAIRNDTLDQAADLGLLKGAPPVTVHGFLGEGPGGVADVEWFRFTLDGPGRLTMQLDRQPDDPTFQGVLSLYNDDPFDFLDPQNPYGHRRLDQAIDGDHDGIVSLDRLLGPGTYDVAVSGAGNLTFQPMVAGSGLPGSTGGFDLRVSVADAGLGLDDGPTVLTSEPAPSAVLERSPLVIRLGLSGPIDLWSVMDGLSAQLTFSPDATFGDANDQAVPLSYTNFAAPASELQLILAAPLGPGYYQVRLAGDTGQGLPVVTGIDGKPLGRDAQHPNGQDYVSTFRVAGIEGASVADDTAATSHDLGDVTAKGVVQVAGTIGDDPFYKPPDPYTFDPTYNPGNDVDIYHFHVSGPGRSTLVAEVFAGRIGSPLDPGVSLYRLDPTDGTLHFVGGNDNSYNPVQSSDQLYTPLSGDPVLFAGLEPGDYYLAVAAGSNTPTPLESRPPGSFGLFDPNLSHSGQAGFSTGDYVLSLVVQPVAEPPHVLTTNPVEGQTLGMPPTQLVVKFDKPVNIALLAFAAYQSQFDSAVDAVFIQGADGSKFFPRFASFDSATNEATFLLLDGLANGDYQLHLSGSLGLGDLGGNPLAGNDPGGDYVVRFTVHGYPRGHGQDPLHWSNQEPNNDEAHPQKLGVLFPNEIQAGIRLTREARPDFEPSPTDTADLYQFQILQKQTYNFTLSGDALPAGVKLSLMDAKGQAVPIRDLNGGTFLFGVLQPGTYQLQVSGWNAEQAAEIAYQVLVKLTTSQANAPPLLSSPAPAVAIRLDSVAAPTPSSLPPPISTPTPPPITNPETPTPPISDPSTGPAVPPPASGGGISPGGGISTPGGGPPQDHVGSGTADEPGSGPSSTTTALNRAAASGFGLAMPGGVGESSDGMPSTDLSALAFGPIGGVGDIAALPGLASLPGQKAAALALVEAATGLIMTPIFLGQNAPGESDASAAMAPTESRVPEVEGVSDDEEPAGDTGKEPFFGLDALLPVHRRLASDRGPVAGSKQGNHAIEKADERDADASDIATEEAASPVWPVLLAVGGASALAYVRWRRRGLYRGTRGRRQLRFATRRLKEPVRGDDPTRFPASIIKRSATAAVVEPVPSESQSVGAETRVASSRTSDREPEATVATPGGGFPFAWYAESE